MNELHPRLRPFVVGTENGCWLWTRSTTKGYAGHLTDLFYAHKLAELAAALPKEGQK